LQKTKLNLLRKIQGRERRVGKPAPKLRGPGRGLGETIGTATDQRGGGKKGK